MDKKKFESLLVLIVPGVVKLISEKCSVSEIEASEKFYSSKLYEKLEQEDTKLWHLSPRALFEIFDGEQKDGVLIFPEEA